MISFVSPTTVYYLTPLQQNPSERCLCCCVPPHPCQIFSIFALKSTLGGRWPLPFNQNCLSVTNDLHVAKSNDQFSVLGVYQQLLTQFNHSLQVHFLYWTSRMPHFPKTLKVYFNLNGYFPVPFAYSFSSSKFLNIEASQGSVFQSAFFYTYIHCFSGL